jgi:hypothetical protein
LTYIIKDFSKYFKKFDLSKMQRAGAGVELLDEKAEAKNLVTLSF